MESGADSSRTTSSGSGSKPKQHFVSPKDRKERLLQKLASPELQKQATSGIITNAEAADDVRSHFQYPSAYSLVLVQIGMSVGYCAYMLTSWIYCAIQRQHLFPSCNMIWGGAGTWGAWACIASSLMFWMFPLLCCIVFLLYMHRDLLHTRLYYEMLSHRVLLDFMNTGFFQSLLVRIMLGWMLLCLAMYPMTKAFTIQEILITLPFWIPVLSFGAMLFTQWDLETRLLSLSKFVEGDVEWANKHMLESFFLRDYVAEAAFHNVIKSLEKQVPAPKMTLGEYIMLIAEEAQRMHEVGEVPNEALASKTLLHSWSSRYWVKMLLYSEYLADEEAAKFQWWLVFYNIFTCILVFFCLALCFLTVITHMHQQGVLPSSILTEWVNLDYLTIVPYNPGSSVPGESQANAVAATVTTGGFKYMRDFNRMGEGVNTTKPLPPHPEHKPGQPISRSGVPTKHSTQHPTQPPMQKKPVVPTESKEKVASASSSKGADAEPVGSKQSDKTRRTDRKGKNKNLIDGLLNRFKDD